MKESTSRWKFFGFKARNLDSGKSWLGYLVTDCVWEIGRDWIVCSAKSEDWDSDEDASVIPEI